MALCIECSPAVQEVPGSDALVSDALCRVCRWPWSSLYIVVNQTCGSEVRAPCSLSAIRTLTRLIKYIRVRVILSHDPQSRACDIVAWGGAVVVQAEVPSSSQ
jgi:hypothetical protein